MRLQTSCSERLPQSYPILDSLDPSKPQSTIGMVPSILYQPPPAVANAEHGCNQAPAVDQCALNCTGHT